MSFWNSLRNRRPNYEGEVPNANPASDVGAGQANGDPDGLEIVGERTFTNPLPAISVSPWAGWPNTWSTPDWSSQLGMHRLIDVAWAAIDLNSSVLAGFPPYRLRNGQVLSPPTWLTNPDDTIYSSWFEFCKSLFWDYQCAGEVFVMSMADGADGYPIRFRVIPPWLINIERRDGSRFYTLGGKNVTGQILHIRNISNTVDAHGHSPLEAAGARMTTAGLLQRYAHNLAETGGVPLSWISVERTLSHDQSEDLLNQWIASRIERSGHPAILSGNAELHQGQAMSAKDMSLLELATFNEGRIAVLCGVPPFLLGLPMAQGESLTYSNASSLFDYHDRSSLRPKATAVMQALSGWVLPRGQSVELNRDEYSRPDYFARAQANKIYLETGVLAREEVRAMERFDGVPWAASAITGAELTAMSTPTVTPPAAAAPARPTAAPPREGT